MVERRRKARASYRRAEAIYTELDLPFFTAGLSVISGPIELLAGEAENADRTLRFGIELLADRGAADSIAYRSALLALVLLAQGRRDEAAAALGAAEPVRPLTRIAHAIAAGRIHDDVALARQAVDLASATEAVNYHADARASLAELLAARRDNAASTHRRIALELYERKGNEPAARALRPAVTQV